MKSLLEQYLDRFEIYPPKLMMTHYEDEEYQELLKQALKKNKPITGKQVEKAYEGIQIDIAGSNKMSRDNPNEVLKRYSYDRGGAIFDRISKIESSKLDEIRDVVNQIVLWKINRMVDLDDKTLHLLFSLRNDIKSVDSVNDSEELLEKLLKSKGMRLPMASTVLHFFNPDVFPIIDQRAYRELYKEEYSEPFALRKKIDTYIKYVKDCFIFYNEKLDCKIPFSEIDKYLYQKDKESGKRIKT